MHIRAKNIIRNTFNGHDLCIRNQLFLAVNVEGEMYAKGQDGERGLRLLLYLTLEVVQGAIWIKLRPRSQ